MTLIITSTDETFAKLSGDITEISRVSSHFQFQPPGYQFTPIYQMGIWDGYIYPINKKNGEFKKGLFGSIIEVCKELQIDVILDKHDFAYIDDTLNLCAIDVISDGAGTLITPYDYQIAGAEYVLKNKRCIIESPTGSGKSLLQYMIIRTLLNNNYKKILIIVPTVNLVSQLYTDFIDYSELDDFSTEDTCHQIAEGAKKNSDKKVYISTWQSLQNIKDKKYFEEFDAVLVDECHTAKGNAIVKILDKSKNAKIKCGFTGTLDASLLNKNILLGLFGNVYVTATTKELMDRGILATLLIKNINLIHGYQPSMEYSEELDYLVSHEKRNKLITNLSASLDGNTLILFQLVEKHGKVLYSMLKEKYPDKEIYLIYGGVKSNKREEIRKLLETKDNAIVIASYQTFQAGINIKKLHNVIFASPSKSKIRVFQSIGRGLRVHNSKEKAVLYDISDDLRGDKKTPNHTLRHFYERLEMYIKEEFNIKFTELEI